VSTTVLREVTEKVKPSRALFVNRPLGYPLGEPNNPGLQTQIIREALKLLAAETPEPLIAEFRESV